MEITMDGNNHSFDVDKSTVDVQRGMILGQLQIMKWVLGLMIAVMGGGFLLFHEADERAHSERAEIRVSIAKLDERMSNMEGRMTKVEGDVVIVKNDMAIMKTDMAVMKGLLLQLVEQRKNN